VHHFTIKYGAMKNTYQHLTLEERERLAVLLSQNYSLRSIAKVLNRKHQTLSRELKRNRRAGTEYIPCKAHNKAIKRAIKQRTKAPLKNPETYLYVREKLRNDDWSPELISGRIKIDKPHLSICTETIYQYIFGKGKRHKLWKYLDQRHKRRRIKSGRKVNKIKPQSKIPGAISIDMRLKRANNRSQIGHLETDLMEGKRSQKTALSVTADRKSRYINLAKVKNKTAQEKQKVLTLQIKQLQSLKKLNKPIVRSITGDNGSENTSHQQLSNNFGIRYYFCHPYHSWEKGTVENTIKRVRRYIPKGSNIKKFTNGQIQWVENKINNRPMKVLNYLTPNEVMEQETNSYKFRKYRSLKESGGALQVRM
jgi:transposase, IS30 family